jgi:hypothetical protein
MKQLENAFKYKFDQRLGLPLVGFEFKKTKDGGEIALDVHPIVVSPLTVLMNQIRTEAHGLHPFAGAKVIAAEDLGRPVRAVLKKTLSGAGTITGEEVTVVHSKAKNDVEKLFGDESYAVTMRGETGSGELKLSMFDRRRGEIVNGKLSFEDKLRMFLELKVAIEMMANQGMFYAKNHDYTLIVETLSSLSFH